MLTILSGLQKKAMIFGVPYLILIGLMLGDVYLSHSQDFVHRPAFIRGNSHWILGSGGSGPYGPGYRS